MVRLTETATTKLPREVAFRNVGDFANAARWDPGVLSVTKATAGDPAPGTVYDVVVLNGGSELEMQYLITDYERGKKVVLEGTGARVRAVDVIAFEDQADGTLVTYTADLSLTGIARLFEPFMKGRFAEIGEQAGIGLRRWLDELEKDAETSR